MIFRPLFLPVVQTTKMIRVLRETLGGSIAMDQMMEHRACVIVHRSTVDLAMVMTVGPVSHCGINGRMTETPIETETETPIESVIGSETMITTRIAIGIMTKTETDE